VIGQRDLMLDVHQQMEPVAEPLDHPGNAAVVVLVLLAAARRLW
jgi:hypothetical protein